MTVMYNSTVYCLCMMIMGLTVLQSLANTYSQTLTAHLLLPYGCCILVAITITIIINHSSPSTSSSSSYFSLSTSSTSLSSSPSDSFAIRLHEYRIASIGYHHGNAHKTSSNGDSNHHRLTHYHSRTPYYSRIPIDNLSHN